MSRKVTLFTGQWADLPIDELLPLVKKMGYDGVELACWGDHFEVSRALTEDRYVAELWEKVAGQRSDLLCHLESPRRPSGL